MEAHEKLDLALQEFDEYMVYICTKTRAREKKDNKKRKKQEVTTDTSHYIHTYIGICRYII